MRFREYQAQINVQRAAALRLEKVSELFSLEPKANLNAPPWLLDWTILLKDDLHIRMKEYFTPMPHPDIFLGQRAQFSYQYGKTTGTDLKGLPRTADDADTIIRIDHDRKIGPHLNFGGMNHILQDQIDGKFVIDNASISEFLWAVETHQRSPKLTFDELLDFKVKRLRR